MKERNTKVNISTKILSTAVAVVMLFTLAFTAKTEITGTQVQAATKDTVTVTVEKFTIGQGFLVEPVIITLQKNDTVATVFDRAVKAAGYTYAAYGTVEDDFYLTAINNADSKEVNIPKEISAMEPYNLYWVSEDTFAYAPSTGVNDGNGLAPDLGEGSYCSMGGWMFTVNGNSLMDYPSATDVKAGDVVRCQFSVYGYGADIACGYGVPANVTLPNKEALLVTIAKINSDKATYFEIEGCEEVYNNAVGVVQSYSATQGDVDDIVAELGSYIKDEDGETVTIDETTTISETTTIPRTTQRSNKISVPKVKINSAKNIKGKRIKVSLKKVKKITGYQIKYAKNAKFKNTKIISTKKNVYTLKKLSKKKYYIKARAYVKVKKSTYYGKWSKVKKVRVKK